jgi:hypothetical protein
MKVSILISIFVIVILGVIFTGIIATQTNGQTSKITVTDSVNIAPLRMAGGGLNYTLAESNKLYSTAILSEPAGGNWRQDYSDCAITTVQYYNQSGALMSSANDYTWVEDGNGGAGWLRLKNVLNLNSSASNTTSITYQTCPDGYQTSSFGRGTTNMIPGFLAILLLMAVVAGVYAFMNMGKGKDD